MTSKKCPVCGVSLKAENLERHVRDQHPHESVSTREVLSRDECARSRRHGRGKGWPGAGAGSGSRSLRSRSWRSSLRSRLRTRSGAWARGSA